MASTVNISKTSIVSLDPHDKRVIASLWRRVYIACVDGEATPSEAQEEADRAVISYVTRDARIERMSRAMQPARSPKKRAAKK